MAKLMKIDGSRFWIAVIKVNGKWTQKSTKKTDQEEAQMIADKWEREGYMELGRMEHGDVVPMKLAIVGAIETVPGNLTKGGILESGSGGKGNSGQPAVEKSIGEWLRDGGVIEFNSPADRKWAGDAREWLGKNWWEAVKGFSNDGDKINCDELVEKLRVTVPGGIFGLWLAWWYLSQRLVIYNYPYLDKGRWLNRLDSEMGKIVEGKVRIWNPAMVTRQKTDAEIGIRKAPDRKEPPKPEVVEPLF